MPIGVLLAALGTPDAPTAPALKRYLRQFLSDRRVIDLNPLIRQPILHGIVLNRRPGRSAALYRRIWTEQGSPLRVISDAQVRGLQERLGSEFHVALGMRYGSPSIAQALSELTRAGCDRVLVLPMYPQYSSATTASIYDAAYHAAAHVHPRLLPALRFVPPHPDHPGYIAAQAATIRATIGDSEPDHYLFTFHGIPQRYADEGDPYPAHCQRTAQRLAQALDLRDDQYTLSYQSRFGSEVWLQPYTDKMLAALPKRGIRRLLAVCPGFTADCLETLDEIGHEGRAQFLSAGGESFIYAPCVNEHPVWLNALTDIVTRETGGWLAQPAYALSVART